MDISPTTVQAVASLALVVTLMVSMGLRLRPSDLLALGQRPWLLAWAALVNFVAVPAVAWGLVVGLELEAMVGVGVMICAAAPGGPVAALYANLARADLPLTVGLTVVLPAVAIVTTPLTLSLTIALPDGELPVVSMLGTLVGSQFVPLLLGMLVRHLREALAVRLAPLLTRAANLLLLGIIVLFTAIKGDVLLTGTAATWVAVTAVAVTALLLGHGVGFERDRARAGALVCVTRNVAVAIMLASTFFTDPRVDATVLNFGLAEFVLPIAVALWWRRSGGGSSDDPSS